MENHADSAVRKAKLKKSLFQEITDLLLKTAFIAVILAVLFQLMFGTLRMEGNSMFPNLKDGDLVLYYRLDKAYVRDDLTVVKFEDEWSVQRIIAVAGDTVDITEDGLYVNGALQLESSIFTDTVRYEDGPVMPLTLAENEIFVLSDNRSNAKDSRLFGPVDTGDTYGTVMAVFRRRNL